MYQTGYFANAAKSTVQRSKVHVVKDGLPLCGSRVSSDASFQWCSGGIHLSYVECETCKKVAETAQVAVKKAPHSEKPLIKFLVRRAKKILSRR